MLGSLFRPPHNNTYRSGHHEVVRRPDSEEEMYRFCFITTIALLAGCGKDESASEECHWPNTYYPDKDGDGKGEYGADGSTRACEAPEGFVGNFDDCNDTEPTAWDYAPEVWYDGIHQKCNDYGSWDDFDQDGDGHRVTQLEGKTEPEGGWGDDCDDTVHSVNPGEPEYPDGLDNNCDGKVDENSTGRWYLDEDRDGHSGSRIWFSVSRGSLDDICLPVGYCNLASWQFHEAPTDCNDSDASSYPRAQELLDGYDNNCDGKVDENAR